MMNTTWKIYLFSIIAVIFVGTVGLALTWKDATAEGEAKTSQKTEAKPRVAECAKTAEKSPDGDSPQIDPMSVNATCCVCHMDFVNEEISSIHFEEKVTCVDCHGLSAKHANDENIGATKPDIVYPQKAIDKMCEKCHEGHDVSPREVVARFVQRKLPAEKTPLCTDCHGSHRIERAKEEERPKAGK